MNKTIKLTVPLLVEDIHLPAGSVIQACPHRANALVEAGHAEFYTPPPVPARIEESAVLKPRRRRAVSYTGADSSEDAE